ncbi:MAG: hypothetical protein J7515_18220 [Caulobacter sp.]|nr:hypothetical protein [Caulobacter sp.]
MTIAIARKFGKRITILSDTMISDISTGKINSIPGRLKAIILSPYVSVAYAGHAEPALRAIRRAREALVATGEASSTTEILVEASADPDTDVEFILALHKDGLSFVHKITARGITGDLSECFIGDADIVRQVLANEPKYPGHENPEWGIQAGESRFSGAFTALFSGTTVNKSVGGFPISLLGSPYGHTYQGSAFSSAWDTVRGDIGITAAQHQSQRTGATAWQWNIVNAPLRGVALLGVALPQAGLGLIYSPLTHEDAQVIRLEIPDGPGFIDSVPLQSAVRTRLQQLATVIGGGVVELDVPEENA